MVELDERQLGEVLSWLKSQFPRSLPVYHLAHNTLRGKYAWPGMEFVVNKLKNPSVCICRPKRYSKQKAYIPMENGRHTFIYSSSARNALRWMLPNDPDVNELIRSATIPDLDTNGALMLLKYDTRLERVTPTNGSSKETEQTCFLFELQKGDFQSTFSVLPEGFRLGALSEKHVEQIIQNCPYGEAKTKRMFFRYMIAQEFPNMALFANCNKSEEPIAYCMYMPQGLIGTFHIHPEYREQGLFKIVLGGLLRRLKEMGETSVWVQTDDLPKLSQTEDMSSLGGTEYPNHHKCWIGMRSTTANRNRLASQSLTDDLDVFPTHNPAKKVFRRPLDVPPKADGQLRSLQRLHRDRLLEDDFEHDSDEDAADGEGTSGIGDARETTNDVNG